MNSLKTLGYRMGFEALYFSGAYKVLRPVSAGMGAILTLHNVRPKPVRSFSPNALLDVTPSFLESVLERVRSCGYDMISIDEVHGRLTGAVPSPRPFVAFTFDDGYRNNAEYAFPLLRRYDAPYALYVATKFADQTGILWWLVLEKTVRDNARLTLPIAGKEETWNSVSLAEKQQAYDRIYWWMRTLPEEALREFVQLICERYDIDTDQICATHCMDWDGIREVAKDPLATIGGHSVNHLMLRKTPLQTARDEVVHCRELIQAETGRHIEHFCFPVGDATSAGPEEFAMVKDLGFKTAVTTRPGVIFPEHRDHLTALPRISLNGHYQNRRYLDVLLSGAPFALMSQFRRVDAA